MAESSIQLNLATTVGDKSAAYQRASDSVKVQEVVVQTQQSGSDPVSVSTAAPMPVQGNVASLVADTGNPVLIGAQFNSAAPTASNGQRVALQADANGNIKVNIAAGAAAGGTSSSFGAAFPTPGTAVGFLNSAGTLMAAGNLDASGNLKVNVASGSVQAITDNVSGFTAGSSQGLPIAYVYNDSASAAVSGDFALPRITANRQMRVVVDAATNGGATPLTAIAPATPAAAAIKASAGQISFIQCGNTNASPYYLKIYNIAAGSVTLGTSTASLNFLIPGNTAGAGHVIPIPVPLTLTNAGFSYAVTAGIALNDNTAIAANAVSVNIGYA